MNRSQLETILKINGVSPDAPEDQIRSVFQSAKYTPKEVETALRLLMEKTDSGATNKSQVDGLHRVFRSDSSLKPKEISNLLGIEIEVDDLPTKREKSKRIPAVYMFVIVFFSIVVAVGAVLMYMYFYQLGPFHPSSLDKMMILNEL